MTRLHPSTRRLALALACGVGLGVSVDAFAPLPARAPEDIAARVRAARMFDRDLRATDGRPLQPPGVRCGSRCGPTAYRCVGAHVGDTTPHVACCDPVLDACHESD